MMLQLSATILFSHLMHSFFLFQADALARKNIVLRALQTHAKPILVLMDMSVNPVTAMVVTVLVLHAEDETHAT